MRKHIPSAGVTGSTKHIQPSGLNGSRKHIQPSDLNGSTKRIQTSGLNGSTKHIQAACLTASVALSLILSPDARSESSCGISAEPSASAQAHEFAPVSTSGGRTIHAEPIAAQPLYAEPIIVGVADNPGSTSSSEIETGDELDTHVGHIDRGSLEIVPAEIAEFTELRVNTGKTRVKPDGEVEAVYEMEYPKDGLVFLEIVLHIAADEEPLELNRTDIMLVSSSDSATSPILAYSIATETGRIPREQAAVSISGQKILRLTFEVDPKTADTKLLVLGDTSIDTVANIRVAIAGAEDSENTTP